MKAKKSKYLFTILFAFIFNFLSVEAQIYAPEGLNMPGSYNGWTNPPTNPVLAGIQGSGTLLPTTGLGVNHYQTIFSTPTNLAAGSYEFLFTSGTTSDYWLNKWANANFTVNTITNLTFNGTNNNTVSFSNNKYYVVNWEDNGYVNTRAVFMELNSAPVTITNVTQDLSNPNPNQDVIVTVATNSSPSENIFIRYTTNSWVSSSTLLCSFTANSGTAVIPGQAAGTDIEYYAFSTTISDLTGYSGADIDLVTINLNNNSGTNYSYTVHEPLSCEGASGVLTTDPIFPIHNGTVTITFDATGGNGELLNYDGDIYAHTGVITSESNGNNDWRYVISDWGENLLELMFTRNYPPDSNSWSLTIPNIRELYGVPESEAIYKIAMVIRAEEPINPLEPEEFYVARNADGSDFHLFVYDQGLNVKIVGNLNKDPLVPLNTLIPICVYALDATAVDLKIDEINVNHTEDLHLMHELNTGDYSEGMHEIVAVATNGSTFAYDTAWFYVRGDVIIEEMPAGVHNGINYIDDNTVTLVLHDPSLQKEFAFVIGDFNNWTASDEGYMKRTPDGTHFWTTITGLQAGVEYAYQYYIDGELKLADPYCDKILDPWNDRWIPSANYPGLKTYPWDLTIGTVSVLQPEQTPYSWIISDFTPQALNETQSNLVIYELLVRDFLDSKKIKDLINKLDYFNNLGITAVELMPIAEFDGNDSWGYAPNFYYAPDKAYGTKNDYKQFIDECHQRGIAVILDVVYNHMYGGSPFVQMYWDSGNNSPSVHSAWFNQEATHPYSIGFDFNHESTHTKNLIKDNLTYWITEYKIDGFRFDLSKGFTQTNTGGDVGLWSQYDQSRINILTEYYNHIKSVNPDAYVILEHFANNDEEVVLANTGCLLWGVHNEQFNQNTMGWDTNHDFSWANYQNRGFTYPNLIPFMESHDEERLMYRNLTYGNGFAHDTTTALKRTEAIVPLYFAIPGPKMIWQFGELGYDESIELCSDGTYENDCRTSSKPIHPEYLRDHRRQKLLWVYQAMAKLKTENEAFRNGTFSQDLSGLGKRMWISHSSLNISITANFLTTAIDMVPSFQHTGTWYNYFTGEEINVTDAAGHTLHYEPGDYYVLTDIAISPPPSPVSISYKEETAETHFYPNPANDWINFTAEETDFVEIYNLNGKLIKIVSVKKNENHIKVSDLKQGLYIMHIKTKNNEFYEKLNIQR